MTTLFARRRSIVVLTLASLTLLIAGCWGTKFPLGPAAAVDKSFVGDWKLAEEDGGGTPCSLVIRNLDGKQYYVELAEDQKPPERYVAFIADVKGAHFAHLRKLEADGNNAEEYLYLRVELG